MEHPLDAGRNLGANQLGACNVYILRLQKGLNIHGISRVGTIMILRHEDKSKIFEFGDESPSSFISLCILQCNLKHFKHAICIKHALIYYHMQGFSLKL